MTARLAAREVSYAAGGVTILEEATLEFDPGELTVVVGPNGAGKTTLIRLLAGELVARTGAVSIDGQELDHYDDIELALLRALLAQDGPADIPFTAATVVALGRTPHRHRETNSARHDAEVVESVLRELGIAHLAGRMFPTLSGGERLLVSLARVLAQETPIVLLDEPTGALDVAVEERTMATIQDRSRGDRAVVAVLHDLNVAARYADRLVVISGGRVVADGVPSSVLTTEMLTEVYRHPMRVIDHPLRPGPLVLVG